MNQVQVDPAGQSPLALARAEMRPHERLVWADRPVGKAAAAPALGRIVFGFVFGGFAVLWTSAAWLMTRGAASGAFGIFFPLFGVPFIAVGAGIVVAGWRGWRAGGSTVYALTDQRVLIIAGGPQRTVRSLDLAAVRGVERREGAGGSGTISLLIAGSSVLRETLAGVPDVARVGGEIERLRAEVGEAGSAAAQS